MHDPLAFTAKWSILVIAVILVVLPRAHRARRSLSSKAPLALPDAINLNVADISDPLELADTPMYWHIPKTAGSFMDAFFHECLGLVVADQAGRVSGNDKDKTLHVLTRDEGYRFVNVDTTSISGLKRAKAMGLVQSGLVDVFVSQYVVPAAEVFAPEYKGRMFALFRHPVDRAVSEFYYLQMATWEPTYNPELAAMTLDQYAHSPYIERNWVTRMLVNKLGGEIYENDLNLAKEIIRRKCLVGLVRDMDESVRRFDLYFGFDDDDTGEKRRCWQDILDDGKTSNRNDHPKVSEGSPEWDMIRRVNFFDMQLYEYAEGLFEEQKAFLQEVNHSS